MGQTLIITKENEDTPAGLAGSNQGEREGIYICVERQLKLKLLRNRLNYKNHAAEYNRTLFLWSR